MSNAKIYNQYAYIAGVKVPILGTVINSNFGSLANLNVSINYSPFITRIYEQSKIQIWEQLIENGITNEPTLEFDGIIIGVQRRRNLLGETSVSLSCLTDGAVWNIRKQTDFYLQDILNADARGTGNVLSMRADGQITNFFSEILKHNEFDIGCAIASVLTSSVYAKADPNASAATTAEDKQRTIISYYQYRFNGKTFVKKILPEGTANDNDNANPSYYNNYLNKYKLGNKVYGVSTSESIKSYFKQDTFINLITNKQNDVYGENTFWQLAMTVAQYGFFNVYDIPNPTFIKSDGGTEDINVEDMLPTEIIANQSFDPKTKKSIIPTVEARQADVTLLSPGENSKAKHKKSYKGLAEYIFKPISIMGIPFKCNVIWPDQIHEESIFYDFFNTPTRIIYKRSPIPGIAENILTTSAIVGPHYESNDFLSSMVPKTDKNKLRDVNVHSPYEKEYGIKYNRLQLSYAFDTALLKDLKDGSLENEDTKQAFSKIDNYLNYEFAQKFLGTRQYSVAVTPDCNPVAGFPIIILNKMGEHVIAFCTGTRKSWSASGQKSVSANVAYPRYYFEDFGDLGNIIDTISQDQTSLDEVSMLIGSKPLDGLSVRAKSHEQTKKAINSLFINFQSDIVGREEIKSEYKRKVCTYKEFMDLYDNIIPNNVAKVMPSTYLIDKFNSTKEANNLTCHYFEVYDTIKNEVVPYSGLSCSEIINLHLEWIKTPKRI